MELQRQPRTNNFVAVPLTSIYAQSWPIPNPDVIVTRNSFFGGRSLNESWVRTPTKHCKYQNTSKMENRIKSAQATRSDKNSQIQRKSLVFDSEDDEIGDTVQEFKLTLQLFKRLTKQVHEVNQYMNSNRLYSFKHHLNNEGIASPALRRSQLAVALSRNREIPATQAPYEPITDLGPASINSPVSRQDRDYQTALPGSRPSSSPSNRPRSSASRVYTRQPSAKPSPNAKAMANKKEQKLHEADEQAKEKWIENDEEFESLFVPEEIDIENMGFRFHDPYPKNWVDETVEDACFRGKRKLDPFMHRLDEFEDLQEETVLWEKLQEEKLKSTTNSKVKTASKKSVDTRGLSARYSTGLTRAKSPGNRIKRAVSAGRGSTTSNAGSEDSDITTFRNSGYDMNMSFVPGSMYPETRPKLKDKRADEKSIEKITMLETAHTNSQTKAKIPHCEACHYRKCVKKHRHVKSTTPTLKAMRAQYNLKSTECYDIVDLAQTFDPPCKDNTESGKKPLTTDEKASKKGLVPGKNTHSQRRISLTAEGMAVRGINPALNTLAKAPTGRSKSAKASVKRK